MINNYVFANYLGISFWLVFIFIIFIIFMPPMNSYNKTDENRSENCFDAILHLKNELQMKINSCICSYR